MTDPLLEILIKPTIENKFENENTLEWDDHTQMTATEVHLVMMITFLLQVKGWLGGKKSVSRMVVLYIGE